MIEPRLYRAAFLPALLAAVIAAFSLEDRPHGVPQGLPADVLFEGTVASSTVGEIVLVAARDALSVPDTTTSASDTAALMELARVLAGSIRKKTVVLASVDGA